MNIERRVNMMERENGNMSITNEMEMGGIVMDEVRREQGGRLYLNTRKTE